MGLLLSLAAFAVTVLGARRSVGVGMAGVLAAGYFYGILRARFPDGFSHFIFDASVLGMYVGHFVRVGTFRAPRAPDLSMWATLLIGWPLIIFALGLLYPQHLLIQLVGLRAAVWFLPFLLLGAWARLDDLRVIARTLAVLNLLTLFVAVGEYFLGLETFFPRNAVTELMYRSNDVAGYTAHRIPATFISAAAYGTTMVQSVPWLVGRWLDIREGYLEKGVIVAALLASALGSFLCASRIPVIQLLVLGLVVAYQLRSRLGYLVPALIVAGVLVFLVRGNERLQRFSTLQDTDMVTSRLQGSANLSVVELVLSHPMGTGLGSAFGTSIPSFLSHLVTQEQIGAENEFARIGLEQSMVGVALWIGFLVWLLARRRAAWPGGWRIAQQLTWLFVVISWGMAVVGCGTLNAVPGTCILLFQMGLLGKLSGAKGVLPSGPGNGEEARRALVPRGAEVPLAAGGRT
jgi:hypothetical protein